MTSKSEFLSENETKIIMVNLHNRILKILVGVLEDSPPGFYSVDHLIAMAKRGMLRNEDMDLSSNMGRMIFDVHNSALRILVEDLERYPFDVHSLYELIGIVKQHILGKEALKGFIKVGDINNGQIL